MIVKLNEYFRTKNGIIGRLTEDYTNSVKYEDWEIIKWRKGYNIFKVDDSDEIILTSKHLCDLIIAGDFVNGYRVLERNGDLAVIYRNKSTSHWIRLEDKTIYEIMTKEIYDKRKFMKE